MFFTFKCTIFIIFYPVYIVSKHDANFYVIPFVFSLYTASVNNAPNIPTLRKLLGQNRKLRKANKKHKNAVKKYLHKQIAETRPIDNIYNMGNFPLNQFEESVLNKVLSFVYSPDMVAKDEVFKAFLKFKRRMLLHYHFFITPTKNKTKKGTQNIQIKFKLGTTNLQTKNPTNIFQECQQRFDKTI